MKNGMVGTPHVAYAVPAAVKLDIEPASVIPSSRIRPNLPSWKLRSRSAVDGLVELPARRVDLVLAGRARRGRRCAPSSGIIGTTRRPSRDRRGTCAAGGRTRVVVEAWIFSPVPAKRSANHVLRRALGRAGPSPRGAAGTRRGRAPLLEVLNLGRVGPGEWW